MAAAAAMLCKLSCLGLISMINGVLSAIKGHCRAMHGTASSRLLMELDLMYWNAVPKTDVRIQAISIWASLPLLQRLEAFLLPYSMYQQQQLQSTAAISTATATM